MKKLNKVKESEDVVEIEKLAIVRFKFQDNDRFKFQDGDNYIYQN